MIVSVEEMFKNLMAIKYLTFRLVVTKVDAINKFEETARGHDPQPIYNLTSNENHST